MATCKPDEKYKEEVMFILNIDINAKVDKSVIDRLVRIHETPQDPVVVLYTQTELPDGYAIVRYDGLVEHYAKSEQKLNPKFLEQHDDVKKKLHEQKERIRKAEAVIPKPKEPKEK